jgi:hypothetical protein
VSFSSTEVVQSLLTNLGVHERRMLNHSRSLSPLDICRNTKCGTKSWGAQSSVADDSGQMSAGEKIPAFTKVMVLSKLQ